MAGAPALASPLEVSSPVAGLLPFPLGDMGEAIEPNRLENVSVKGDREFESNATDE